MGVVVVAVEVDAVVDVVVVVEAEVGWVRRAGKLFIITFLGKMTDIFKKVKNS